MIVMRPPLPFTTLNQCDFWVGKMSKRKERKRKKENNRGKEKKELVSLRPPTEEPFVFATRCFVVLKTFPSLNGILIGVAYETWLCVRFSYSRRRHRHIIGGDNGADN